MIILNRVDPNLKRVIDGYLVNFLRANYWKIQDSLEWDDAVQEAWLMQTFMEKRLLKSGKDSTIITPPQYMACFITCWTRHFSTLIKRAAKSKSMIKESDMIFDDEDDFSISDLVSDDNLGYIEMLISEAPSEIKEVISLLLNAPKEVLEMVASSLKKDVTSNVVLCSILGHDPKKIDIVQMTRTYLLE